MGRISARFQTEPLTAWPVTEADDGYGTPVYGAPYTIACEYDQNSRTVSDNDGVQFVPSWTFYTQQAVSRGDYVALGDNTASASPTTGARPVRAVRRQQNIPRQGGDDYTIYCG